MKRLILKKLIVISKKENESLEVNFKKGLNVILGGNKTGKSSIIKSIFAAFGCECKMEDDWKKLISTYIIYFLYGDTEYCILRKQEEKVYKIFRVDNQYNCISISNTYGDYAASLMSIFGVSIKCIVSKSGKEESLIPPLLFKFQYIDQDYGWQKIAQEFTNMKYIKNWSTITNKYVSHYMGEEYYEVQTSITKKEMKRDELQKIYSNNSEFVEKIVAIQGVSEIGNTEIESNFEHLIEQLNEKRMEYQNIVNEISNMDNKIFTLKHQIKVAELAMEETKKDVSYAVHADEILICPTCGAEYKNSIINQMELTTDIALAENLLDNLGERKKELEENIKLFSDKKSSVYKSISTLETQINNMKSISEYNNMLKNEGKHEILVECQTKLDELHKQITDINSNIWKLEKDKSDFESNERKKQIKNEIIECMRKVANNLNMTDSFISLRDFVQINKTTGSDGPRITLMYQVGLYLYNLQWESPFNFIVIDTPNQQGQDKTNLGNIDNVFELLCGEEGQVILGTERKINIKGKISNLIELNSPRKCLSNKRIVQHLELLNLLNEIEP